jgi:hypothetical protein
LGSGVTSLSVSRRDVGFLTAHLARLSAGEPGEPGTAVRVVVRPESLGVYSAPPLGVVCVLVVPLAAPAARDDRTVAAGALHLAIEGTEIGGRDPAVFELPAPEAGVDELRELPPSDGWHLPMQGVAEDLVPLVDAAVAELRARSAASPALRDAIAAEIWDRPAWAGLPMRVLHAARLLGFLGRDGSRVAAATAEDWKRLTTVRGQVFVRSGPAMARLRLVPST